MEATKVNCYNGELLKYDYYLYKGELYKLLVTLTYKRLKLRTNNTGYTHYLAKNMKGKTITINTKLLDGLTLIDRPVAMLVCPHCGKVTECNNETLTSDDEITVAQRTPEKSETPLEAE
jgi:hypothetical protein